MRLRFQLSWMVLALALALTGLSAYWMHVVERGDAAARFEQMVNGKMAEIEIRVDHFEVYLRGINGLFASSAKVTGEEWRAYVDSLGLSERRDSFLNFGFAPLVGARDLPGHVAEMRKRVGGYRVEPAPGDRARFAPVTLMESVRAGGTIGIGDDLLSNPVTREAIETAERSRKPALSRRIDLTAGSGRRVPGATLVLPFVREGRGVGFAYLQFRLDQLVGATLAADIGGMSLRINDQEGGGEPLFATAQAGRTAAAFTSARSLGVGGRQWALRFESTPSLEGQLAGRVAGTIAIFGALGSFLLFGLIYLLSGTRWRAVEIAERTTKALSDQMKLTEDLIELNPIPFFRKDTQGHYLQFNRAWERMTGRSREDWIGKSAHELFPPEEAERFDTLERELLAHPDQIERTESTLTAADGAVFDVIVNKAAVRRSDGTVVGIIGTIIDMTETRRLTAQNENQREQLALVNQSAQAGVWDIDWPVGKAYFSPRYYEMLGYAHTGDGLQGARSELVHPDDRARVEAAREAHFNGTLPYFDCEYRLRRADGGYLWVNGRGLASLDGTGRPVRFTGSIIDITQRRMAQLEIEHQREQLELVIESVQAGVWDDNLIDGTTYFSHRYREILGFTHDEDLSGYALDTARFHPEDLEEVLLARDHAIANATPMDLEYRLLKRDGGYAWVNARAKASYDAAGFAVRFTGAIIDITKRKEAEFALRDANLRVLEAAQVKSTFLATMSHEIRTPLNGVIGSAGLLLDTRLNAEQQDYVETIRLSGEQLLTLIDDILDFSKIESGRMELEDAPVDLASVVEDAFDLLAERARGKRLELLYDIAADVPHRIRGDITRIRQVLINLVGNAVKFTEKGEVYVNCSVVSGDPAGDEPFVLRVTVHDTGIGIAEDKLNRLFVPFSQVDASTTRKYGGTGLGLAISRRLVGLMGGEFRVESKVGAGSTFEFTLTTRRAPEDQSLHRRMGEIGSIAGKRVLIVDDYASNRRILAAQCATWGLWTVETASVKEALEAVESAHAAETPFDAVVSDMLMPEQDGVDLARELAAHRKRKHVRLPVIILSSAPRAEALAGREVPEGWIDAYILKPARQTQLFNALLDALAPERPFHLTGPESVPRPGAMQAYSGKLHILLAEDNEINQKIAVRMLERLGKTAVVVDNGRKAVDLVLGGEFDCVLMDVQMPELDGLEATRRIVAKADPVPYIIAMTANAMAGDREVCLAAGMNDYIAKPVQLPALTQALARAQQFLGRRENELAAAAPPPAPQTPHADGGHGAPPALDGALDMTQIEELVGLDDSGAVLADFIDMYTTQAPQRIAEISQAFDASDFPRIVRVAHSLKGASGNLGAVRVADVARRMEMACQAGEPEGVDRMIDEIRARYVEAEAALKALPQIGMASIANGDGVSNNPA